MPRGEGSPVLSADRRERRSFAKIPEVLDVPNLIAIQRDSFTWFLDEGLRETFQDISPIEDFTGTLAVEFGAHEFGEPKYSVEECKEKDMSFQAPLFVDVRFINKETGEMKEQSVFMGDFPLMTDRGTFVINGTERVVVSQLVRSPGVYYAEELDKTTDKIIYTAKVIPARGAWLELETDRRDIVSVRVDRKRKQPATVLLKALGIAETREEILEMFDNSEAIERTLERDFTETREEALLEIYKRLRPGEPPTVESARALLDGLFFNPQRYDLAKVGRYKVNKKLGLTLPDEQATLTPEDIKAAIYYLVKLWEGKDGYQIDDIDHFGNRRIRSVGELIQNQFRIGLARMERVVRERMTTQDVDEITPQSLINIRPIVASIKEFFGSSQLSQFMDQTNPVAGLTHKRRLSALGPGGLSRERAGFEVRDVHPSHYGRMCPIETPEGPNIGLIGSLATFARINPYGFIETPYRKVVKGKVTDEIVYLTADEEERHVIAQANEPFDVKTGKFANAKVLCRVKGQGANGQFGEPEERDPEEVDYMDVSPRQMVSVATALIPFLEHDDANRALMGSNMQRQAVPLLRPSAPLVGTGLEYRAAKDTGEIILAKRDGVVERVDSQIIVVRAKKDGTLDEYHLPKFQRSNQGTCINHRPLVRQGEKVKVGQVLADGPSTEQRRTGAGPEPPVRVHAVGGLQLRGRDHPLRAHRQRRPAHLDPHRGVRGRGARHQARPRRDHPRDPQRRRGRAPQPRRGRHHPRGRRGLPGRRARGQGHAEGRDRAHRRGAAAARDLRREGARGARHLAQGPARRDRPRHRGAHSSAATRATICRRASTNSCASTSRRSARSRRATSSPDATATRASSRRSCPIEDMPFLADGTPRRHHPEPARRAEPYEHRSAARDAPRLGGERRLERRQEVQGAVDGPDPRRDAGVRRCARGGDLRGHRGLEPQPAAQARERFGKKAMKQFVPTFTDGGKTQLFDGRTGEPFREPVTVGQIYILKLLHLVDDKIHARSTGPYSLDHPAAARRQGAVRRPALRRDGSVGARTRTAPPTSLQEILTVKSDDILGRVKTYEAIVKGENIPEPGIPESFKVLVKEMQSLCLDVEIMSEDGDEIELREEDEDIFKTAEELGLDLGSEEGEGSEIDSVDALEQLLEADVSALDAGDLGEIDLSADEGE